MDIAQQLRQLRALDVIVADVGRDDIGRQGDESRCVGVSFVHEMTVDIFPEAAKHLETRASPPQKLTEATTNHGVFRRAQNSSTDEPLVASLFLLISPLS